MPSYSLKFIVEPKDLELIRASGQRITLAKPVNTDTSANVVWLSIDPFASTDVEWSEEYGIYASTTAVSQGAAITKLSESEFPAIDGANYTFTSGAIFNGPFSDGGVAKGSYGAQNDMPQGNYPVLTFGLTQSALVNKAPAERKPISATPVLATQSIVMTPFTNVYVWLQSQFASETIITKITGKTAKARFGGGVSEITLKYDAALGVFVPAAVQGLAVKEHPAVELSLPTMY